MQKPASDVSRGLVFGLLVGINGVTHFSFVSSVLPGAVSSISPYIKHYEGLSYDREALHNKHLRVRRATRPQDVTLKLEFTAFNR